MSEENEEQVEQTTESETDEPEKGEQLPDDHPLVQSLGKANKEAEKWRKRAKELEDYERRVKEAEDADKSEVDKAKEQATEAERRAKDAEAKALRFEVATEKGVPKRLMRFLTGSTQEDLEEQADALLEEIGSGSKGTSRPKEWLKPGASNAEEPDDDPKKIADSVMSSGF